MVVIIVRSLVVIGIAILGLRNSVIGEVGVWEYVEIRRDFTFFFGVLLGVAMGVV